MGFVVLQSEISEELIFHLARHRGFCVFFVYADNGLSIGELRNTVAGFFASRTIPLQIYRSNSTSVLDDIRSLIDKAPLPVWLEMTQIDLPDSDSFDSARTFVLGKLNEWRSWLQARFQTALIIVLPLAWRTRVATTCPDLWHVRIASFSLDGAQRDQFADDSSAISELGESSLFRGHHDPRPEGPALDELAEATGQFEQAVLETKTGPLKVDRVMFAAASGLRLADAQLEVDDALGALQTCAVISEIVKAAPLSLSADGEGNFIVADMNARKAAAFFQLGRWEDSIASAEVAVAKYERLMHSNVHRQQRDQFLKAMVHLLDTIAKSAQVLTRADVELGARKRAVTFARALVELEVSNDHKLILGDSLCSLAAVEFRLNLLELCVSHANEAMHVVFPLVESHGPYAQVARRLLAILSSHSADAHRQLGRLELADRLYADAVQNMKVAASERPHDVEAKRDLSIALRRWGDLRRDTGSYLQAETLYGEAMALTYEVLQMTGGEDPMLRQDLSVGLDRLGDVNRKMGLSDRALDYYQRSLQIRAELAQVNEGDRDLTLALGVVHSKVGDALRDLDRHEEALQHYKRAEEAITFVRVATGDVPRVLDMLALVWERLAVTLSHSRSDRKEAAENAVQLRKRLVQTFPTSEYHRDRLRVAEELHDGL